MPTPLAPGVLAADEDHRDNHISPKSIRLATPYWTRLIIVVSDGANPADPTMNPKPRKRSAHHHGAPKMYPIPIRNIAVPKGCDFYAAMFYRMRRSRVPEHDPLSLVLDFLFHRLADGQLYITLNSQQIATFASDNWSWPPGNHLESLNKCGPQSPVGWRGLRPVGISFCADSGS
jgi:hypothetical protein